MNEQRQIEELAKIEGVYIGFWCHTCGDTDGANTTFDEHCAICGAEATTSGDYLNSHDSIQRVIDGMDEYKHSKYACRLCDLFADQINEHEHLASSALRLALKATPAQKCEAVLKAYGKWEDGQ